MRSLEIHWFMGIGSHGHATMNSERTQLGGDTVAHVTTTNVLGPCYMPCYDGSSWCWVLVEGKAVVRSQLHPKIRWSADCSRHGSPADLKCVDRAAARLAKHDGRGSLAGRESAEAVVTPVVGRRGLRRRPRSRETERGRWHVTATCEDVGATPLSLSYRLTCTHMIGGRHVGAGNEHSCVRARHRCRVWIHMTCPFQ